MGLAYLQSRKAFFPPPDPLVWETPNTSVRFRDYINNGAHNLNDTQAAIEAAMNEAAQFEPESLFPRGVYRWVVGSGILDCFIKEGYMIRNIMTFGEWMEALSQMWRFNQNYQKINFAVDVSVKETNAQGRTELVEQGDCYIII